MKKKLIRLLIVVTLFCSQLIFSQDLSRIATVEVDDLTDAQIENFWVKAKDKGYTLVQIEKLVKTKGMPYVQVEKLKDRIRKIELKIASQNKITQEKYTISEEEMLLFGLTGKEKKIEKNRDSLFGYDFFNNPRISFTPNINVATPQNYQLGPGDIIQIDVWGAAEANYREKINKQGNIKIPGVGSINISGLSFETATSKVKSYLRRIYSGINAPKNSYNKVYVSVSLAEIRTVQVNMVGEVKTPGTYSLTALSTVLNALYAAGGPTREGTFRKISLIRNGQKIEDFDFYQYLLKGSEKGNLQLQDQDVVIVSPYKNLTTVIGEVKRPGIYEIKNGETMKSLLDYCGGFTAEAYKNTIIVERIDGMEREMKEVSFKKIANFQVKGGDKITIQKVVDKFENRVKIDGAVYQPGSYEFVKGMTATDLIKKAAGVKKEAFLSRALITRYTNEVDKEIIAFSVTDAYNSKSNVMLQPNDELYVYSKEDLREKRTVTISGAVNDPKTIDFAEGMTAGDLIAFAGGLKEGADTSNIEISRRSKDSDFETVGKIYTISSDTNLHLQQEKINIEPYDVVYVRYLKGYTPQKNVTIKGEVEYPGEYIITVKNERISDLIKRAGGLSPYAYVKGATLIRKKMGEADKEQQKLLREIKKRDTIFSESVVDKKELHIGINLQKILDNKKGEQDLILQEGDELLIPSEKQTVEVQGEVYLPSLVRYIPGKSMSYYIESAGGFTQNAKKSKTYAVYSNGSVDATNNFLFFKSYPNVEPGATILVPKKEEKRKMSAQEIIGITTGVATLGVLINTLVNSVKNNN